ncbi:MAG: 16S rRNA (cytidine(1402)-2'-O)-methyltransferase [Desulfobacterales bacterium]|nr:16S rRNA (cytidine(1402)-2'-O)-methyltransferase [Desulfobacterales bacterium]
MNDVKHAGNCGSLYVVATPIGNRDDITLRALEMLKKVDVIAAEDTRYTGRFLAAHDISADFVSYHDHNEDMRAPVLIDRLKNGESIALLSNAGTPLVSDPGYRLINEAIANKINVIPIPGVSAAIAALSVSGLPTDSFVFAGFLAKKRGKRLKQLKRLANDPGTIVFYESPKRIIKFMEEIVTSMGDRYSVLAREMTKVHEEFIRGRITEIIECLKKRTSVKGEITLLVTGKEEDGVSMELVRREIEKSLKSEETGMAGIVKNIAEKYEISRSKVYKAALTLKEKQQFKRKGKEL